MAQETRIHALNQGWLFRKLDQTPHDTAILVDLPHSPMIVDLDGRPAWFGECEYRRVLPSLSLAAHETVWLYVGAAMHSTRVFVDGREVARNQGGYLPFEIDLTPYVGPNSSPVLSLRVDNRDNPDVPPGKPFAELDFCWYAGLYRDAELRIKPAIHLTEPISAAEPAGGGVFLRTLSASSAEATILARTHIRNGYTTAHAVRVKTEVRFEKSCAVTALSDLIWIPAESAAHVEQALALAKPQLWTPATPALYHVVTTVLDESGHDLDQCRQRFGVRQISFSRTRGFTINGQRLRLRGTNRHQEYPRVGYAAPRAAQYRDALCIKEAGFDYVRLSHYPQSPEFLDACDVLGIVVMNCIPGWQFLGGARFRDACFEAARQLIRRDRNHPCVVLWELSLNETPMDESFMRCLQDIGHEEYPGDQMFTCGWIDRYDVFSHSRQHGEIHRWSSGDKALVIAEYGDWEYFARNDGFDQKSGAGVFDRWSTSRQFRRDGERGLRQQASNHVTALNDTLASPAVLDGQWAMFDYARGYDPVRAAVGVMDVFRLPKFSYFFFRSQRDATESGVNWTGGSMVFIASHWTTESDLRVVVFSNCEEIELRLNGDLVARQRPAHTALTQHLPHPPFFFDLPQFVSGDLEATGFIDGQPRASHHVTTPRALDHLEFTVSDQGVTSAPSEPDLLLAHARLCDDRGTLCVDETSTVTFTIEGAVNIVGPTTIAAEAGVASIVLALPAGSTGFTLRARIADARNVPEALIRWQKTAGSMAAVLPPHLGPS